MKTIIRSLIIFLSIVLLPIAAHAADAAAGGKKAVTCIACHGKDGISIAPNYPNLACQKDKYLIKAIKEFKSGARKDPIMKSMVGSLSDADIENLAAYFSTLNCK
ncbi:MAG: cytochrome c [Gammaproteobacteria bacterium]|jgi:cytochrome c553|nr:cytochrome c [Gammaproteobacteria bacterium]MDX2461384.1 cytochrome c [Gammaproteobacteria bacterium]